MMYFFNPRLKSWVTSTKVHNVTNSFSYALHIKPLKRLTLMMYFSNPRLKSWITATEVHKATHSFSYEDKKQRLTSWLTVLMFTRQPIALAMGKRTK